MRSYITEEKRRKCFMWFPILSTTVAIILTGDDYKYELEIKKGGLFKREIKRINMYRITDVSYYRNLFDLMWLRGNLEIHSTDPKYKVLRITKIRRPKDFGDCIERIVKGERDRAGVKYQEFNVLN